MPYRIYTLLICLFILSCTKSQIENREKDCLLVEITETYNPGNNPSGSIDSPLNFYYTDEGQLTKLFASSNSYYFYFEFDTLIYKDNLIEIYSKAHGEAPLILEKKIFFEDEQISKEEVYSYVENNDIEELQSINHRMFNYDSDGKIVSIDIEQENSADGTMSNFGKTEVEYEGENISIEHNYLYTTDSTGEEILYKRSEAHHLICPDMKNPFFNTYWRKKGLKTLNKAATVGFKRHIFTVEGESLGTWNGIIDCETTDVNEENYPFYKFKDMKYSCE